MLFRRKKSEVEFLREEIGALRELNKELTHQVLALTNPHALAAVGAVGAPQFPEKEEDGEEELLIAYNELGQRILCRKGSLETQ